MAVSSARPAPSADLRAAYSLFRLEREGNLLAATTFEHYDRWITHFFRWLALEHPDVKTVGDLSAEVMRVYRAYFASEPKPNGKPKSPATVHASHRAIGTFLRWAHDDGMEVDTRLLKLRAPRVPKMEQTVFSIHQLNKILDACNGPTEALVVRLLIGSGMRASEVCGLCLRAPDGLSDVMADSMERRRAEIRVRWDAGAKGKKSRRIPITRQLALEVSRYIAKVRRDVEYPNLLIGYRGTPYVRWGVDSLMDRLQERVGFRVHAHAFRHTFATVATQNDWNLEKLRVAMGHSDYSVLQRYVSLAAERDLGPRKEWSKFILLPEIVQDSAW